MLDDIIGRLRKIARMLRKIDIYPLLRPLLFKLDPEEAHHLAIRVLEKGLGPNFNGEDDPILAVEVCGLSFPNPIGLAAGFDKQCEVMSEVLAFGFGFVEVGSITPLPQTGNPKPRLFRVSEAQAAINRFGFNSDGMDVCNRRIAAWRDRHARTSAGVLGINVGKNKDTQDAAMDYVAGIKVFATHADYLTVNISSPNTPGLRDLQGREELARLIRQVEDARNAAARKPPVFIKIAPDLTPAQEQDIVEVSLSSGVEGIIIGNTTVSRPASIPADMAKEQGGLSGKPLFEMSTQMLGRIYKQTEGKILLVGCGGIFTGADAYAKIRAGASLVQLYTALVYRGPGVVPRIKRELAALLRRDGFASVADAVGADQK